MKRLIIAMIATVGLFHSSLEAKDNLLQTAAANGSFNILVSLVVAADLNDALQGKNELTVFAPSDEAFAKLPKGTLENLRKPENRELLVSILKYHVVAGEIPIAKKRPSHPLTSANTLLGKKVRFQRESNKVKVNDATIVSANIECSNGLIHVIDRVLLPPQEDENSILGTARKTDNFKTLLAAIEAAGLTETLNGKGPFTVFAPTDDAFKKLPRGTVDELLKPENRDRLTRILKYHVVSGRVSAKQAVSAGNAATLANKKVMIGIKKGRLTINDATVISNDLKTSNGIIHVIDRVLLPGESSSSASRDSKSSLEETSNVTITSRRDSPISRDGIEADTITIQCLGAGSVRLTNVKARRIITRVGGGGSVLISGTTKDHEVSVSGGGTLSARNLLTANTEIQVNGGGNATINAEKSIVARANAGATLRYVETGAKIEKQINKYADFTALSKHSN